MHIATLLSLCVAWSLLVYAAPLLGWIPEPVIEDFKDRGGDVIAASIFLFILDYMINSIVQDAGYGSVTQEQHNRVVQKLAEKMDEIEMMKRMLGGKEDRKRLKNK